jgi:hypothetical protein
MERSTDMGRQLRPAAAGPVAVGLAVSAALLTGCGGPPPAPSGPQTGSTVGPAVVTALPDVPSPQAEMVCLPEAQQDIQDLIGVVPTAVGPIQYANHTSTCRYAYANGAFTLVVQDLPNDITTARTYETLAAKLGRVEKIDLPDAEAFTTNDGSIVLRRDTKVMLVDVAQLPGTFGNPPSPRADAARLIMKAVLNCWVG